MAMSKYASYNRGTGTEIKLSCPSLLQLVQQILDSGDTLKSERFILFRTGGRHAATKNEPTRLSKELPEGRTSEPEKPPGSTAPRRLANLKS